MTLRYIFKTFFNSNLYRLYKIKVDVKFYTNILLFAFSNGGECKVAKRINLNNQPDCNGKPEVRRASAEADLQWKAGPDLPNALPYIACFYEITKWNVLPALTPILTYNSYSTFLD